MKRLLVAPHCDDETLGAGGYLAKHPDTVVLVVCKPDEDRFGEFAQAMSKLGVLRYEVDGLFGDGWAGDDPRLLTQRLDHWLAEFQPEEFLIPAPGTHQDHVSVYEAGMRSARLSMNSSHWSPPSVLAYEVPVYPLELYPTGLRWNVFENLSTVQVRRKADAMNCYSSQVPNPGHRAAEQQVWSAARVLGSEVGVPFAERYSAVRVMRP